MGLSMLAGMANHIVRTPSVGTVSGLARHLVWHAVRRWHALPMTIPLTENSRLRIAERGALNGCAALAWSLRLYDYNNMSFLLDVTRREGFASLAFDVGANIGAYSLLLSEAPGIRVEAFEPHPVTFRALEETLRFNERTRVSAHGIALSNRAGTLPLSGPDFGAMNRLLDASEQGGDTLEVKVTRAEDVCGEIGAVPQVVKVDTEGHEGEVLQGFGRLIDQVKIILTEENPGDVMVRDVLPRESFAGPYYLSFPKRQFLEKRGLREDAVFIHKSAMAELASFGYQFPGVT